MNTIRSVGYGWGVLCLAGGGAYYFAKRSINSDRAERAAAEEQRRQQRERLRATEAASRQSALHAKEAAARGKPAPNAIHPNGTDPAPGSGDHAHERELVRGDFEAKEPFRSRKGDRFS